jgi:hypothetical protein
MEKATPSEWLSQMIIPLPIEQFSTAPGFFKWLQPFATGELYKIKVALVLIVLKANGHHLKMLQLLPGPLHPQKARREEPMWMGILDGFELYCL